MIFVQSLHGNARCAVAEIDQNAAFFGREFFKRRGNAFATSKHIGQHIGAMQARWYRFAIADFAMDEGEMVDGIKGRNESVAGEFADFRFHGERSDAFNKFLARWTVGDEIGH